MDIIKSSVKGIAKGLIIIHVASTFSYHIDDWWPSKLSEKLEDHIERYFLFTTALTAIGGFLL